MPLITAPFKCAQYKKHEEILEYFLQIKTTSETKKDIDSKTIGDKCNSTKQSDVDEKKLLMEEDINLLIQDNPDIDKINQVIMQAEKYLDAFDLDEALTLLAIKPGNKELVDKLLLNCKPSTSKSQCMNLYTAVFNNIQTGHVKVAKLIIKHCGGHFKLGLSVALILKLKNSGLARFIYSLQRANFYCIDGLLRREKSYCLTPLLKRPLIILKTWHCWCPFTRTFDANIRINFRQKDSLRE